MKGFGGEVHYLYWISLFEKPHKKIYKILGSKTCIAEDSCLLGFTSCRLVQYIVTDVSKDFKVFIFSAKLPTNMGTGNCLPGDSAQQRIGIEYSRINFVKQIHKLLPAKHKDSELPAARKYRYLG
jgi:hypothetical protein